MAEKNDIPESVKKITTLLDKKWEKWAGVSGTEKLQILRNIQTTIQENAIELKTHGHLQQLIEEIRDFTSDGKIDTPLLPRLREAKNITSLGEKFTQFFDTITKTGDEKIITVSEKLQTRLSQLGKEEKEILLATTPLLESINLDEKEQFYQKYGKPGKDEFYQIYIDRGDHQKAYLITPEGSPVLRFTISTGRVRNSTPKWNFEMHRPEEDSRTRYFQKFWQEYKLQTKQWMLDWKESHPQMTTAILPLSMPGDTYLHGTNKEAKLGKRDSGGCIRMDNVSIAFLSILLEDYWIRKVRVLDTDT